jgi:hypothetical protein
MEMVRDPKTFEAGGLRALGLIDEFLGSVLFAGQEVSDFRHDGEVPIAGPATRCVYRVCTPGMPR